MFGFSIEPKESVTLRASALFFKPLDWVLILHIIAKVKIILLTSRFPFPPIGGDKLRFFNICKYLKRNHDVSIISFAERPIGEEVLEPYRDCYSEIDVVVLPRARSYINCILGLVQNRALQIAYYRSAAMKRLIAQKIKNNRYDVLYVHLIRMAEYVKDYSIFKLLDMTDAQSLNYTRSLRYREGLGSMINRIEARRVRDYEQKIWKYFDNTLVVSPIDLEYLKTMAEDMNVELLANGVDIGNYEYKVNCQQKERICFLGNMRTYPNTDAVEWFCHKIFPNIRREIPSVEFYIIGAEPSSRVLQLAHHKNIIVTGSVSNVSKYVHSSSVSVVPMRVGAGIQNKILESMALGTPVVSTSLGLEGIACIPGKHLCVADDALGFANTVVELLHNKALRLQLSFNARRFVEENYPWGKALARLDTIISRANNNN